MRLVVGRRPRPRSEHNGSPATRIRGIRAPTEGRVSRFMPQDSRRRAGITTFLNCVESRTGAVAVVSRWLSVSFRRAASVRFDMALVPVPAHRTGQAHVAHPALGERFTRSPTESCLSASPAGRGQFCRAGRLPGISWSPATALGVWHTATVATFCEHVVRRLDRAC